MNAIKKGIILLCPPILIKGISKFRNKAIKKENRKIGKSKMENPTEQDLNLYWDPGYANILEEWGKDNTWNEIQLLIASCNGKILDIACGTGITIKLLEKYKACELYGFDISDLLIQRAIEKGIPKERLAVADATATTYKDNEFNYSYSIGSLEHFTLEGIDMFIRESVRYTKTASFHMIPVSRSGEDEGWMKTTQSFFNNSEKWWFSKFDKHFKEVYSIPSKWEDSISFGRWFICFK